MLKNVVLKELESVVKGKVLKLEMFTAGEVIETVREALRLRSEDVDTSGKYNEMRDYIHTMFHAGRMGSYDRRSVNIEFQDKVTGSMVSCNVWVYYPPSRNPQDYRSRQAVDADDDGDGVGIVFTQATTNVSTSNVSSFVWSAINAVADNAGEDSKSVPDFEYAITKNNGLLIHSKYCEALIGDSDVKEIPMYIEIGRITLGSSELSADVYAKVCSDKSVLIEEVFLRHAVVPEIVKGFRFVENHIDEDEKYLHIYPVK